LGLRGRAAGEVDFDLGAEAASVQRFGRVLQDLRVDQAPLRRAHCGVGSVQYEVRARYAVDHLLVRCREIGVGGDRKLVCFFDCGCAAAEIEQQVLYRSPGRDFHVVGGGETRRNDICGKGGTQGVRSRRVRLLSVSVDMRLAPCQP
jgi:hypothetical protein